MPNLKLSPITPEDARKFIVEREHFLGVAVFNFAISVIDEEGVPHGVIGMYANGKACWLGHLYTDGTALVGSILYGAAWRVAKALGYSTISL